MKTYALDEIYDTERKCFIKLQDKPLNIVFIGDSLTEGDSSYEIDGDTSSARPWHWVDKTAAYLGMQTGRAVNIYNAGVGGTTTGFVGKMISETTFAKNADIVFIENINDINRSVEEAAYTTENLVRNLAKAEKVPAVILFHALSCFGKRDEAHYLHQAERAKAKDDIVEPYGIKMSINYLDAFYNETKFDVTHKWYLEDFGETKIANGDVHPLNAGYSRMGDYIISQIEENHDKLFTKLSLPEVPIYPQADYSYKITYPASDRFNYFGFNVYTSHEQNKLQEKKYMTPKNACVYPFGGVSQSVSEDGTDYFEFKTDAKYISICYKNPGERFTCNTVKVYVDGEFAVNGGGSNPYANNYGSIDIPLDGKEHVIKVVSDIPTDERDVFNFLFLVEGN